MSSLRTDAALAARPHHSCNHLITAELGPPARAPDPSRLVSSRLSSASCYTLSVTLSSTRPTAKHPSRLPDLHLVSSRPRRSGAANTCHARRRSRAASEATPSRSHPFGNSQTMTTRFVNMDNWNLHYTKERARECRLSLSAPIIVHLCKETNSAGQTVMSSRYWLWTAYI